MHTITSWDQSVTILRRFECCYSVFAFSETRTSQKSNHRPFLFTVITVQYPATNIEYTLYKVFICSVGRISFASFQILSGRVAWLENCLVHLVHLAISAAVATDWSVSRWSGNIGNICTVKWCTTASICCVDDVNTRTASLTRWEIPTDFGHLATCLLPAKKCADRKKTVLYGGWHGSRPFISIVATTGDSVVTAYGP